MVIFAQQIHERVTRFYKSQIMHNVAFSPNRKGDNKILTPKEENSVPRGEAARDRILLPAG